MKKFFLGYICLFRTFWYTMRYTPWPFGDWEYIDGCDFKEQDDGSLKCSMCGKVSK